METLTGKLFTTGCQFQITGSHEKSPLYITGYNSADSLILPGCKYACEYGRELRIILSLVLSINPEYRFSITAFLVKMKLSGAITTRVKL
jgi:hypothetical protein